MKKIIILTMLLGAISLTSCKPTEKNYKAAYDAALGKREAVKADIEENMAVGPLQQVDGPQLKVVDGVEVYLLNKIIKPDVEGKNLTGQYNVAVGCYKMNTNCKAQAEALRQEGYDAFPAKDPEDMYYTIAGSFPDLAEAVKFYKEYQKNKNRVYVGLPDAPIIIFSPI